MSKDDFVDEYPYIVYTGENDTSSDDLKVKPGSITSDELVDGAVTTGKIADGAVTAAKIAEGVIPSGGSTLIVHGTTSSDTVTLDTKAGVILNALEDRTAVCALYDIQGVSTISFIIAASYSENDGYSFTNGDPLVYVFTAATADDYPSGRAMM